MFKVLKDVVRDFETFLKSNFGENGMLMELAVLLVEPGSDNQDPHKDVCRNTESTRSNNTKSTRNNPLLMTMHIPLVDLIFLNGPLCACRVRTSSC